MLVDMPVNMPTKYQLHFRQYVESRLSWHEGVANGKIRDAKILVRNPSLRLFGKKFRDSKK